MTSDETIHDYRGRISAEDAAANIRSNMQLVDSAMSGKMESLMNPHIATGEAVADFVDRLAENLRDIADEMRNVGASSMKPHELLACYAREVDKVADSLKFAATLGNGTCEVIGSYYYDDYDQYEFEFSCGHSVNMYDKEPPNYCPNCGAKVIQGVYNAD